MKIFELEGHAPSLLPEGMDFELVWNDEFDGDRVDPEKWDYRLSMMGLRHPAWTDKGVTVENGCAVFRIFEENGEIVSSQLQTGYNFMDQPVEKTDFMGAALQWPIGKLHESKFLHSYGYYECRCRLQKMKGWWSAFWIQSPIIGATLDAKTSGTEIDIMECFKPGVLSDHWIHSFGYGLDRQSMPSGEGGMELPVDDSFHTFGLLWTEKEYVFYVDGKEDGRIDKNVSAIPEFILISTETNGYRGDPKQASEEAKEAARCGDTFLVDHVRVFDIKR